MSPATLAPTTNDLVRFLLARFDEDDDLLKHWSRDGSLPAGSPIALDRLRSEALSRRRIVGSVQQLLVLRDQPCEKPVRDGAVHILRALAAPYASHTGFRPEWKTSPRP
ncbi:MAG TPA: DUF6221 family protein [Jatrophihabitans sp.]|nr:DUF6221 family protein [Jatrophihabitans sp.]